MTVPLDPGDVTASLAEVATQLVLNEDGWEARCAPAAAGHALFALGPEGLAVLEVFRGLITGVGVMLGGAQSGVLSAMSSAFVLASRATIPVVQTVDFALWLLRGVPLELACAHRAGRPVECSWDLARMTRGRPTNGGMIDPLPSRPGLCGTCPSVARMNASAGRRLH